MFGALICALWWCSSERPPQTTRYSNGKERAIPTPPRPPADAHEASGPPLDVTQRAANGFSVISCTLDPPTLSGPGALIVDDIVTLRVTPFVDVRDGQFSFYSNQEAAQLSLQMEGLGTWLVKWDERGCRTTAETQSRQIIGKVTLADGRPAAGARVSGYCGRRVTSAHADAQGTVLIEVAREPNQTDPCVKCELSAKRGVKRYIETGAQVQFDVCHGVPAPSPTFITPPLRASQFVSSHDPALACMEAAVFLGDPSPEDPDQKDATGDTAVPISPVDGRPEYWALELRQLKPMLPNCGLTLTDEQSIAVLHWINRSSDIPPTTLNAHDAR